MLLLEEYCLVCWKSILRAFPCLVSDVIEMIQLTSQDLMKI